MTEAMPFLQKAILLSYDPRPFAGGFLFRKKKGPPLRPAPQFMLAKRSTAFVKF